jgi:hypothetical protein
VSTGGERELGWSRPLTDGRPPSVIRRLGLTRRELLLLGASETGAQSRICSSCRRRRIKGAVVFAGAACELLSSQGPMDARAPIVTDLRMSSFHRGWGGRCSRRARAGARWAARPGVSGVQGRGRREGDWAHRKRGREGAGRTGSSDFRV